MTTPGSASNACQSGMVGPVRRWTTILGFVVWAISFLTAPAHSQVPCDFKGVSVGDKLTREQLMLRLGIPQFKIDPPDSSWEEIQPLNEKYGITPSAEIRDDKLGPYCRETYCNIPFGLNVSDDNIPVKVFVSLKNDTITEIEVSFNSIFWNDIFPILTKKYGSSWNIEKGQIGVMDYETKKIDLLEHIIATHRLGGRNSRTNDTCSLTATNIDIIFRHHDMLGALHAIFVIKRESKDF